MFHLCLQRQWLRCLSFSKFGFTSLGQGRLFLELLSSSFSEKDSPNSLFRSVCFWEDSSLRKTCKHCKPRPGCSCNSSLIWAYTVCKGIPIWWVQHDKGSVTLLERKPVYKYTSNLKKHKIHQNQQQPISNITLRPEIIKLFPYSTLLSVKSVPLKCWNTYTSNFLPAQQRRAWYSPW